MHGSVLLCRPGIQKVPVLIPGTSPKRFSGGRGFSLRPWRTTEREDHTGLHKPQLDSAIGILVWSQTLLKKVLEDAQETYQTKVIMSQYIQGLRQNKKCQGNIVCNIQKHKGTFN